MKKMLRLFSILFLVLLFTNQGSTQLDPTLSIQGILKKSNGVAVEDGNYTIIFKLYTAQAGGMPIWTETQNSVEVSSGIYNASLGTVNPLNVAFDQLYYLGVTVGSTELTPRILLTSAPYALSLIGQTNKFPSSGKVLADSILVGGGVLARGGAPGLNGVNRRGYAFAGNSGDNDSGLYSTANGKVAMYANNVEVLTVTPTAVQSSQNLTVAGTATAEGVAINNNGGVSYNGLADWRLVSADYLENGADGWQYAADNINDDRGAWKNPIAGTCPTQDFGDFAGKVLRPANNDYVIKKQFSPPGSYNYVKVVFKFFSLGNWDPNDVSSRAYAAFANDAVGGTMRIGWSETIADMGQTWVNDYNEFRIATSIINTPANNSDSWTTGTMIGTRSTPFWVYFGYANNESESDEHFAVGSIEVWVR